jgi:TonB family protein
LGARSAQGGEHSELFLLDENAAYPTYHPSVVVDGWRDQQWLTVQFQISPNGRFRVALLEGTGDPVLDALALDTLRQWKWQPKTVKGRPVASTEVLRLKRKVSQGL